MTSERVGKEEDLLIQVKNTSTEKQKKSAKKVPKCLPRRSTFTWQYLGVTSEKLIPGVKMGEQDLT